MALVCYKELDPLSVTFQLGLTYLVDVSANLNYYLFKN